MARHLTKKPDSRTDSRTGSALGFGVARVLLIRSADAAAAAQGQAQADADAGAAAAADAAQAAAQAAADDAARAAASAYDAQVEADAAAQAALLAGDDDGYDDDDDDDDSDDDDGYGGSIFNDYSLLSGSTAASNQSSANGFLAGSSSNSFQVPLTASDVTNLFGSGSGSLISSPVDLGSGPGGDPATSAIGPNNAVPANVSSSGYTVLLVSEAAQLPGGQIASQLGANHQWVAVYKDGQLQGAAGLGNAQGIPGANGQRSPDSPFVTSAYVVDHTGRMNSPNITTQPVYFVDPNAVLSNVRLADVNRNQGPWILGTNDCNTWCRDVITNSTPQWQQMPQISAPGSNPMPVFQQFVYPADGTARPPTTITSPGRGPGG